MVKLPLCSDGGLGAHGFGPRCDVQVTYKRKVSSYFLTRKDSVLWGAFVTER